MSTNASQPPTFRSIHGANVVVVGGAGFLGSHLVNYLVETKQCKVLVVDNLVTGRRKYVHSKAQFVHADITQSEDYLRRLFRGNATNFVFNYAAQPYIPLSFARPSFVLNTNTVGALNVINAAHDARCEAILQVSSAEIYGEPFKNVGYGSWTKLNEDTIVIPHSSYGATKAAVDFLVQCRWREAATPCMALRQFNCIGERETHPYVVPEIISQLAKQISYPSNQIPVVSEKGIVKLGNNAHRDFLYAGDAVRMAVELLEVGRFGEVYNLGSESSIAVYDLASMIGKIMGFEQVIIEEEESRKRPWEIWHLQSDNTKVYGTITRRPLVSLEDGLRKTVDYYRGNGGKWAWE